MLYLVMLEKLEARYTAQWARWIPQSLDELNISYQIIEGDILVNTIETGDVLDIYGTNYYKASQLQKIIKLLYDQKIKDGDTIWFADLWFPGIEMLEYIRCISGIKFKITGVLHAGTWDEDDFTVRNGFRPWAKYLEKSWLSFIDKIFVGSKYHKQLIEDYIEIDKDKIQATGLFFDYKEVEKYKSDKDPRLVVFPHRLAPEKRPELFKKLADELSSTEAICIRTFDICRTKEEYYQLLGKATYMVSFDGQETFGYSTLESIALGVVPLVFNGRSYQEIVPKQLRWDVFPELLMLIREGLRGDKEYNIEEFKYILEKYLPVNISKQMFLC